MVCKGIRKEYECRSNEVRLGVHVGVWQCDSVGCGSVGCGSVRVWQCEASVTGWGCDSVRV